MHAPPWSPVLSEIRQMTSDTSINPILPQMTLGKANLPFNTGAPSVFTSDRNANKQRNMRSCCDGMMEKIVVNPTSYCVFLPVHISCNKSLWFERGEKGRRTEKRRMRLIICSCWVGVHAVQLEDKHRRGSGGKDGGVQGA
ncbi:hypothetical protein fugu_007998 [Takifugu bimaculatus]|uniref:Uncharacterized protein n=1 Tax=Takifugu bimaculatus TaxID=433685 RepID=A0A4Z2B0J5_9TELE|nr:hypothetical protein fugu_007998 [Takifugu bimaculatus]